MEPKRYAIVDAASGLVANVVMWDGDRTKWSPPKGTEAHPSDTADIGDDWSKTK